MTVKRLIAAAVSLLPSIKPTSDHLCGSGYWNCKPLVLQKKLKNTKGVIRSGINRRRTESTIAKKIKNKETSNNLIKYSTENGRLSTTHPTKNRCEFM